MTIQQPAEQPQPDDQGAVQRGYTGRSIPTNALAEGATKSRYKDWQYHAPQQCHTRPVHRHSAAPEHLGSLEHAMHKASSLYLSAKIGTSTYVRLRKEQISISQSHAVSWHCWGEVARFCSARTTSGLAAGCCRALLIGAKIPSGEGPAEDPRRTGRPAVWPALRAACLRTSHSNARLSSRIYGVYTIQFSQSRDPSF